MKNWVLVNILLFTIVTILFLIVRPAFATDTGATLAGTGTNDTSIGTKDWLNPTHVTVQDGAGNDTICSGCRLSGPTTDTSIKLFIAGSPSGNNKALGTSLASATRTYGGAADLWTATSSLTVTAINASDFGLGISVTGNGGTSHYLYASDFGFAIPSGSTINGVLATVGIINTSGNPSIDYIKITVSYTAGAITASQSATSMMMGEDF